MSRPGRSALLDALPSIQRFVLLLVMLYAMSAQVVWAQQLPEFLKSINVSEIFPGADRLGPVGGKPAAARAYAGTEAVGYVFLTSDIVNTAGYSSKPIDTLVGIDNTGKIVGAKLVRHHEPIVLIGIPQSKVEHFIQGYVGLNFIETPARRGAPPPVDIVSGATVTLMVIGDSITRSSVAVARAYGIGKAGAGTAATAAAPARRVVDLSRSQVQSWEALLAEGAVQRLELTVADVNQAFVRTGRQDAIDHPEPGDPNDEFIDLYAALVSVPAIGRSLLGDTEWGLLKERLKPGQQAILVAGNGPYSFKGSGYVRGGIFDRVEVIQGEDSFRFRDRNHQRMADIAAEGAPRFREIALFTTPDEARLDPVAPWRLQLMVQRVISVKDKAFVTFDLSYTLPQSYSKPEAATPVAAPPATAAQPQAAEAPVESTPASIADADADSATPLWKHIWRAKTGQIAGLLGALLLLVGVFFFQDQLTSYPVFYDRFRLVFLTFTLLWIGWYSQAQLSVVNVLTFTSALRTDFRWEYFLMDPMVFILWSATAISLVFWNRGAFCGWLCPFGALQELTNRIAKRLGIRQIQVPFGVNQRLSTLKYVIFLVLFGFSLYELTLAEQLAEVEPFKTAIVLRFMRYWPFVLFAVLLLVAGLFIERFFCRYLCPLGAALAIPARLRIFNWLRRYHMCGNPCQLCGNECPVQAIDPRGEINPNECIQCLHCQMLYHNEKRCPHLIQKRAKRERNRPPPVTAGTAATAAPAATEVRRIVRATGARPSSQPNPGA